ncbi:MAG: PilC/PilY family type IV pilus protein [Steroidobacteraceae bacterium]
MNMSASIAVRNRAAALCASAGLTVLIAAPALAAVSISQVPLTIAIPAHPQILLAVANSQSMDGDLSGAIMTGSGALGSSYAGLYFSSSPPYYSIPAGFTPPLAPGNGNWAPYTVSGNNNVLFDNSASRMNVAKAGISAILDSYMDSADFALMDYKTGAPQVYGTWVYQMSLPGGFTFTSRPSSSIRQVANPCYQINTSNSDPVAQSCLVLSQYYPSQSIAYKQYVNIAASSDDPSINDVYYAPANSAGAVCISYGGASPSTPYPPNYTLAQFNLGTVIERYPSQKNKCPTATGPTNAGYVPSSTEVLYEQRGFGFYSTPYERDGNLVVNMTTAGNTPTAQSVSAAISMFTQYLAPETNQNTTTEMKSSAVQSPIAGILSRAATFFSGNLPTSNGCPTQKFVLLLTDGLPTLDLNKRAWPPLGSAAAAGYGVTATFNADGSLASTNDQALTDSIAQLTALNAAGVKTYIIGLGAGLDPVKNPIAAQTLTAMAMAGGTGAYFASMDPTALTDTLNTVIIKILKATQAVASVAVNSTGLNASSVVYQGQFTSSDTNQDWTGSLYAFPANPATGVIDTKPADALWSASAQLDAQDWDTGRLIATWDPAAGMGIPFRWNGTNGKTGIGRKTTLGLELSTFQPDTNGQDVVDYLRGSTAQAVGNGGTFRDRSHILGDIVFSNPVYVGPPSANNLSSSYLAFASAHASRTPVLYVGANDGMLHAFRVATGDELFAYIPTGVFANLINLVSPYYNSQHLFYVDASPQSADVQFSDLSWHTLILGTEGAGGRSVFALDVSDPAAITDEATLASHVLWDFTDTDMGLSYAKPAAAKVSAGTMIFFGNGYNSNNQRPFLYALDPQTGRIVAKLDLCAMQTKVCTTQPNGLSSATAVNSSGASAAAANVVYAGDLQGNLWRIDVSNSLPSLWSASVILQAKDAQNNPQPITTAPVATLNPKYPQLAGTMVFVGTGQLLGSPDLSNTQVQTIYGVYDPNTAYATPLGRSGLVQQTLTAASIGSIGVATVTTNSVSLPSSKGWYIDLTLNTGERVVNNPLLRSGTLLVTSTQPSPSPCVSGGNSFSYYINFANGSSFPSPQFDVNKDGIINAGDTVTNANGSHTVPVGIQLGAGFFADATVENSCSGSGCAASGPSGFLVYNCAASGSMACTPRYMKGAINHRVSWWEIRR